MHDTLDAFWIASLAARAAEMSADVLRREHDAACAEIAEAMAEGRSASASAMRRVSVFQAERWRRAAVAPDCAPRPSAGPVLVHYETSIGDGPGSLPIRMSNSVLCF